MEKIRQLIVEGKTDEALCLLDQIIAGNTASDETYYLRGNVFRKHGDWKQAMNNYLKAMELNPDSPAKNAYKMIVEILDFYNKDMFNQ